MKNIPNIITIARILLSLLLFAVTPFSSAFYVLYITAGLTDMADGYLARKWGLQSKSGAVLDSVADVVFITVMLIVLLRKIDFPKMIWIWIVIIASARLISLIIGYVKYKKTAFLHTYLNKFTGLILFAAVLFLKIDEPVVVMKMCCMVASVSALEEVMIQIKSQTLDRDVKSIMHLKGEK